MCTKCPIFLSDCRKVSMFSADFNTFFLYFFFFFLSGTFPLNKILHRPISWNPGLWEPTWYMRTDRWTDGQVWRRQEALFASMRVRLERQRTKTGTVTWSVTVLLFCHVNAVMTGNSNCQYSASTCVGKRQGFPSFVCRTAAGYKSVCIRKVPRPTDRPTNSTPVFSLPLSYTQMPWRCQISKLLPNDFCAALAI